MLILDTVALLLEHHSRLCLSGDSENGMENKERLFDVPIRMVSDINQQVHYRRFYCRVISEKNFQQVLKQSLSTVVLSI